MNMPGTVDEHPNWRMKMPPCVGDLMGSVFVEDLLEQVRSRRGNIL